MSILVTAPTAGEIKPFLRHAGKLARLLPLDLLVTGVGTASTVYSLLRQITLKKPALMIQAGVAGSFTPSWSPGMVAAVGADAFGDLGVMEGNEWKTVFDLGLEHPDKFPYSGGWLRSRGALARRCGLKMVKAVTVSQVTTDEHMQRALKRRFRPAIESLEGAAFHYVALREGIPFLQLRAISNFVGERNRRNWKLAPAIANLNRELLRIVKEL